MMGSESSLSLSEITVTPPPETLIKNTKTTASEPDVDELIEKWRNLDVGSFIRKNNVHEIAANNICFPHVSFYFQNGLPCLLEKTRQDIGVSKVGYRQQL